MPGGAHHLPRQAVMGRAHHAKGTHVYSRRSRQAGPPHRTMRVRVDVRSLHPVGLGPSRRTEFIK
jgi:hypothetical protein